ncbi:bacterial surface protein [Paenibacillus sp. FSL H8-0079]|uniref:bacterial surface protein n=1 Tax=Paenibacillus sp. FSL H8-0079 TaxID=2921375 RepID=UPI0030EB9F5B
MKKIVIPALLSLLLLFSFGTSAFAASVGEALATPEDGWKRYDDTHPGITYIGTWGVDSSSALYNNTGRSSSISGSSIKFTFEGSKFRWIGAQNTSGTYAGSSDITVNIDGNSEKVSQNKPLGFQILTYEKTGLTDTVHTVEIINNQNALIWLDAIDIDGELLDPTTPTPGPEPQPEPNGDRAILVVTLTTGLEKEYDLPISDVNAFLSWYDVRDTGIGPSKFAINKYSNNKGPFSKRTDYMIFDKILTFEVSEYTTK